MGGCSGWGQNDTLRLHVWDPDGRQASGVFCQQPFETGVIQHRIGQKTLQLRVLGLQVLQPS
jgi:hypothetical protein